MSDKNNSKRRSPYSKVKKENQVRADHVKGKGDTVFLGFQCLNSTCTNYIFIQNDDIKEDFEIVCPECSFSHHYGGATSFYDYEVHVNKNDVNEITEKGTFSVLHDEYLAEAKEYKYCIICNTLKPLEFFDNHKSRKSGRQGECRLCKKIYNSIKNGTRLIDQHREAAQKRRLYLDIAGSYKINSDEIYTRYDHKCFNCNKDLRIVESKLEKPLDHTLPVYYLWPLTTENATLLCRSCNGEKSGSWPADFYPEQKLKQLSILTGIDYKLLSGPPRYNQQAINFLMKSENVNQLLIKYSAYIYEILKLRNRLLKDINFDFLIGSNISTTWIKEADKLMKK